MRVALLVPLALVARIGLAADDGHRVDVRAADARSLTRLAGAASALPGVRVVQVEDFGVPNVALVVEAARVAETLPRLRQLPGVRDVVELPRPEPHLDDVVWHQQSGDDVGRGADLALGAPLFAHGITGRGLALALADEGIENDECRFLYGSSRNEASWAAGPSADSAQPIPQETPLSLTGPTIRTRERKVVAQYVQAGALFGGSATRHGTACAAVAVGDRHDVLAARPIVRDLGRSQNAHLAPVGGSWGWGDELRPDLLPRVDDPRTDDPSFPDTHGPLVEHHGTMDGVAPGGQLIVQDIGDASGSYTFTVSVQSLLHQASMSGATAWLAPWGSAPCADCYRRTGVLVDAATRGLRDLVVVTSAGNDGDLGLASGIADAKNALVVGATVAPTDPSCPLPADCPTPTSRLGEAVASFSGVGLVPGRIKPDVVAPGVLQLHDLEDAPVAFESDTTTGDFGCFGGPATAAKAGTSLATSSVAGLALLVQQYFHDGFYPIGEANPANALRPTSALVRAVIVNSARNLQGARTGGPRPNGRQGWGSPRLDDTLYFVGDPTPWADGTVTERRRLLVINDVPTSFTGADPLSPEPGGRTRDRIVAGFRTALSPLDIHEFFVEVAGSDGVSASSELRLTLAWNDAPSPGATADLVNDLDLEVVSPGPDGVLQTTSTALAGDDVVYRTRPVPGTWEDGFTRPSPHAWITTVANLSSPPPDRDDLNTVENVFVEPAAVVNGTWRVRVIARWLRGFGNTHEGWPNFALFDRALTRDLDGDGAHDVDEFDFVRDESPGYALIGSGPFVFARSAPIPPHPPRPPRPPRR